MKPLYKPLIALVTLTLTACAAMPNGPSAMALPGTGKSFDQFRADDNTCRGFAQSQIGGQTVNQSANESFVNTAVLGTVVGALIGAAAGGHQGAGVGAATGLAFGSVSGANQSQWSAQEAQSRYDNAYIQCMYANGQRVPVSGSLDEMPTQRYSAPSNRSSGYYPPPPPPPNR